MRFWLTVLAVMAVVGLAVRMGRGPEKFAAGFLAANFLFTIVNRLLVGENQFYLIDPVVAAIDLMTFAGLTWIALRANRIWPLTAAALQLLVMVSHVSVVVHQGYTIAYWGMMICCQYIELATILVGTFYHSRRERMIGRYRSWRIGAPRFSPPRQAT